MWDGNWKFNYILQSSTIPQTTLQHHVQVILPFIVLKILLVLYFWKCFVVEWEQKSGNQSDACLENFFHEPL